MYAQAQLRLGSVPIFPVRVPVPVPVHDLRQQRSAVADSVGMTLDHERLDVYRLALPTATTSGIVSTARLTERTSMPRVAKITLAPTVQLFVKALTAHGIAYGH